MQKKLSITICGKEVAKNNENIVKLWEELFFFKSKYPILRTVKITYWWNPAKKKKKKKLWYIYTVEYYSAIKRNTFESVLMRWMNLEPIIQSEVNQKEKDKYYILTCIYGI